MALRFLVLAGLVTTLVACENCGPANEPLLHVNVVASQPITLDSVRAVGATAPLSVERIPATQPGQSYQFTMPVNLTADSVRYQLRIDGRWEDLTVFYRRSVRYQSPGCGYVLTLLPPPPGGQARSSRGTVPFVTYEPNRPPTFLNPTSLTGISLTLRL